MPTIAINGCELYYEDSGPARNQPDETIVFSHGLLMNGDMFAAQVHALREHYRCITYDHRGQGRSAESTLRCIDMETVAADAVALIEKLGVGPVHFCGLSMGGFAAMRLALRRPELLRSIILMNTTAEPEPIETITRYRIMNWAARLFGVRAVLSRVTPIMFGHSFLHMPGRDAERAVGRAMLLQNRRSVWRAVNGVIERESLEQDIKQINLPTLVLVGTEDVAIDAAHSEPLAQHIPNAKLIRIAHAGHSSSLEEPAAVTAAIADFLTALKQSEKQYAI
ncbi:MAG TPA: alpha/beta fold hydrolase [Burkholderiaceae bacterium]|jgi:3-oxoadipate enol-lactonase|nr:alpha/beta fold hydrolase [Burkholderiaceae bacterium]